jgi:hypothetical protein
MTFDEFLNRAWAEHGDDPALVANRLNDGLRLIERPEHVLALAGIVTHVYGEHLGDWNGGESELRRLLDVEHAAESPDIQRGIHRSIASLRVSENPDTPLDGFSESDRVRVLCVASSAACGQNDLPRAIGLFDRVPEIDGSTFAHGDGAYRALAVTGNNLANALLEKSDRTAPETDAMLRAAMASRKYWEISGTWLEVERAEYTIAKCMLAAGRVSDAVRHAGECLDICVANNAPAFELFFAHEIMALVERALGNMSQFAAEAAAARVAYEWLGEGDRKWCTASLEALTSAARSSARV